MSSQPGHYSASRGEREVQLVFADGDETRRLRCKLEQVDAWAFELTVKLEGRNNSESRDRIVEELNDIEGENREIIRTGLTSIFYRINYTANLQQFKSGVDPTFHDLTKWSGCRLLKQKAQWGLDNGEQNDAYSWNNHLSMIHDRSRVEAYAEAIVRNTKANPCTRAIDIGTGPFCLLSRIALGAGAKSVTAIEHAGQAVDQAISFFKDDYERDAGLADYEGLEGTAGAQWGAARMAGTHLRVVNLSLPQEQRRTSPRGDSHRNSGFKQAMVTLLTEKREEKQDYEKQDYSRQKCQESTLELLHGYSGDVSPLLSEEIQSGARPQYNLVVHEILGHVASAEGAGLAVRDLKQKGLCAWDCLFVPRIAETLIAPTSILPTTALDSIVHRFLNGGDGSLRCGIKHHCQRFPREALLAPPQAFERLDFEASRADYDTANATPGEEFGVQRRTLVFHAARDGRVDGFHLHLYVHLNKHTFLDVLDEPSSSWSSIYVRLSKGGVAVSKGTQITCICESIFNNHLPRYEVMMRVGATGSSQTLLGSFAWTGCS
mmetsp:Transcript_1161/g.1416  ORF Transcript_1161/g.1416 Transcript_1161/m.1416 type:complete len:547 (-) Transcript_1161:217-1857(-)